MGTERQIGQHQQLTQSPEIGSAHSANQAKIDFIITITIKHFAVVVRNYAQIKIRKTEIENPRKKNLPLDLSLSPRLKQAKLIH